MTAALPPCLHCPVQGAQKLAADLPVRIASIARVRAVQRQLAMTLFRHDATRQV